MSKGRNASKMLETTGLECFFFCSSFIISAFYT